MQAPALVWDEKLVASAKAWAATCTFGASRTAGVGENLGFGYSSFLDAVKGWYQQVRLVCVDWDSAKSQPASKQGFCSLSYVFNLTPQPPKFDNLLRYTYL